MDKKTKTLTLFTLITLLVLLEVSTSLAQRLLVSDWVNNDDILNINDQLFYVKISDNGQNVVFSINGENTIIPIDTCKDINDQRICVNNTHVDSVTGEKRAYLRIYYKSAEMNITREFSKTSFYTGEIIKGEIIIKNTGDDDAQNIEYSDVFPQEFTILSLSKDCYLEDNTIRMSTDLSFGSSKTCTFKFASNSPIKTSLVGELKYSVLKKEESQRTSAITLSSSPVFDVKFDFESKELVLGNQTKFNISVTNLLNTTVKIKEFRLTLPQTLDFSRVGFKVSTPKVYNFTRTLSKNESYKDFDQSIYAKQTGDNYLIYDIYFELEGLPLEIHSKKVDFKVKDHGVELISSINDNTEVEANADQRFFLKLRNLNNLTSISNFNLKFQSNYFPPYELSGSEIGPDKIRPLIDMNYVTANISTTQTYYYSYNLTYTTEYGERKDVSKRVNFKITPQGYVTISKTISKNNLEEGESAIITLKIKNNKNIKLYDVIAHEILPIDLSVTGVKINRTDLDPKQEVTFYSYKIIAPELFSPTSYNLTTRIDYKTTKEGYSSLQDASLTYTLNLLLNPRKPNLQLTKTVLTTNPLIGDYVDVSYEVSNTDSNKTVTDIVLYFSQSQDAELLNNYKYEFSQLEPGESIKIDKETIIPKTNGKITLPASIIYYKDSHGNLFNTTTASSTITAQNAQITRPLIYAEFNATNQTCNEKDLINITLTLTNLGPSAIDVDILSEYFYQEKQTIPQYQKVKYQRNYRCQLEGETYFDKAQIAYVYDGKENYAYSNDLKLTITKPKPEVKKPTPKTETQTQTTNTTKIDADKQVNIIIRFMDWVGGLMGKFKFF